MSQKNFTIDTGLSIVNGGDITGVTDISASGNVSIGNLVLSNNSIFDLAGPKVTNGDLTHGSTSGLNVVANGDGNATVLYNTYGNVAIFASSTGANVHNYEFGTNGNVSLPGNLSAAGNITANYLFGNGSQLSGISVGSADKIVNGTSNVEIPVANSNVVVNADGAQWIFDGNGNLTIPNGGYINFVNTGGITQAVNEDLRFTVSDDEEDGWAIQSTVNDGAGTDLTRMQVRYDGVRINTDLPTNNYNWDFRDTGEFDVPKSIRGPVGGNLVISIGDQFGSTTFIDLQTRSYVGDGLISNIRIGNPDVTVSTASGAYNWSFGGDSHLIVPGNIHAINTGFPFTSSIIDMTAGSSTVVVTLADNLFPDPVTGQVVISGVVGATEANNTWWYQAVETNAFQLYTDSTLTTPVDGSTWSAYISAGLAVCAGYNDIAVRGGNVVLEAGTQSWTFDDVGGVIFPQLTVQRGDNPSGTIQGQTLLFGDNSQEAIISTPDGVAGNEYSQRLVINPGSGYNYGEGGDIYLWAGRGGNGGGSGGDIKIRGGQGGAANGQGGYIRMEAGDGDYAGGAPGFIEITGGSGGVGQNGGYVRIQGGQGQNSGADANITGGVGQTGPGGPVNIVGGVSGLGLADYGNVNITSGASTWTFDNTGTLNLSGGTGTVESSANNISIYSDAGQLNGMVMYDTGAEIYALQDFAIFTDNANASHIWRFYANGSMTTPGAINVGDMSIGELPGYITADANTGIIVNVSGPDGGFVVDYLKEDGNANTSGGELAFNSEIGNATYRISLSDDLGDGFATKIWRFDGTGNITLPGGGSVYSEGFTPSGNPGNTIVLNPHGSGSITNQKLMLYPTAGDGDHLHMTTGNLYQTELFLGSDDFYVKLANTGNVVINSNDSVGNIATWTFDNTGTLTVPGEGIIQSLNDTVVLQSKNTGSGNIVTARLGTNGGLYFEGTEYPNGWLSLTNSLGDANITAASGTAGGAGKSINITAGDADQTDYYTTAGGDVSIQGGTGAFNDGGGGGPGGSINIAAGTSADPAGHAGNVNISAGVNNWVFDYTGNLTLPTNTFTVNYANGAQVSLGSSNYGDSNVASFLAAYGSNTVSTTGNITAGNFIGSGANVDIAAGSYDWTFDNSGNLTAPGNISTTGNVQANFVILSGGIVGSGASPAPYLSGFSTVQAVANITGGNILTGGLISSTGNITGNYILGNGSQLTAVNAATVDVLNTNGLGTTFYPTFVENRDSAEIVRADVDLTYRTDTNTLSAGNLTVSGTISATGNITGTTNGYTIGYRDIPQVTFSANATAALTDAGKHYYSTTAGNLALTLPDNSSVAFPTGATLTLVVNAAGNILVNQGTSVSLYMAGSSTTGNRVVGAYGLASVMKVAANTWVISGTGVY